MDDLRPPPPPVPELHPSDVAPEPTEVPWRAREAFLIGLISLITGFFFAMLIIATVEDHEVETLLATIAFELGTAGWTLIWLKVKYDRGLSSLKFRIRKDDIGLGVMAAIIGMAAVALVSQVVSQVLETILDRSIKGPEQLPAGLSGGLEVALAVVAVALVAPVAEEMFFRGFLYQALRKWKGPSKGAAISAFFFALAHFSPIILPGLFALGFVFAHVFERQDSLGASMIAHATYNGVIVTLLLTHVVQV
jgi:hypothetical protein